MDLGRERSLAHPRHISLGHRDHRADSRRTHASPRRRSARRHDGFGDPPAALQVPIQNVGVRALTGKEPRHRLADSGGGAGDQYDPILQHGHIITRRRMAMWRRSTSSAMRAPSSVRVA